ncbi:lactadherin-like [Anneissia japonica]|uniref:lactadherin-like n=1 Tax=Anneissia japonica TaxID=1529436 RepID=UPI0014254C46|nr:lactadherin-like [Anneissia japonica]
MLKMLNCFFFISSLCISFVMSELCIDPLGVEDGTISDEQLSASSEYSFWHGAHRGRLNTKADSLAAGAWCSKTNDQNQWIQVDLGKLHKVHGVITQGRNNTHNLLQWVTSYEIFYSVDGNLFQPIRNSDFQVTKFEGNSDQDTAVTNIFPDPVYAQFARIHPVDLHGHICLRFEVLGCSKELCIDPLGVEDGTIPDEQLSASSESSNRCGAHHGRLNTEAEAGAWCSKTSDQYQWIQVDLGKLHKVQGVITQGRNEHSLQWVTSYEIFYSVDGNLFQPIRKSDCQVTRFVGNSDQDTNVTNIFPDPVYAQFVRIHPVDWHRHISLRFEVLGCSKAFYRYRCMYKQVLMTTIALYCDYNLRRYYKSLDHLAIEFNNVLSGNNIEYNVGVELGEEQVGFIDGYSTNDNSNICNSN